MKKKFLLLLLFAGWCSFAQQLENSHWYFGIRAGINFSSTGTPTAVISSNVGNVNLMGTSTTEGVASVSDKAGNLLFYTDGIQVWDSTHHTMPIGTTPGTLLLGNATAAQAAVIVPHPHDTNLYYIFTAGYDSGAITAPAGTYPYNYAVVNIASGSVTESSPVKINSTTFLGNMSNPTGTPVTRAASFEAITATLDATGDGVWVLIPYSQNLYSYKIDATGFHNTAVVSSLDAAHIKGTISTPFKISGANQVKVSPDNQHLVISSITTSRDYILHYPFNATTGAIGNMDPISCVAGAFYGMEFSGNSEVLYATRRFSNPSSGIIYGFDLTNSSYPFRKVDNGLRFSGIQRAFDGQIYVSCAQVPSNQNKFLYRLVNQNSYSTSELSSTAIALVTGSESTYGLPQLVPVVVKQWPRTFQSVFDGAEPEDLLVDESNGDVYYIAKAFKAVGIPDTESNEDSAFTGDGLQHIFRFDKYGRMIWHLEAANQGHQNILKLDGTKLYVYYRNAENLSLPTKEIIITTTASRTQYDNSAYGLLNTFDAEGNEVYVFSELISVALNQFSNTITVVDPAGNTVISSPTLLDSRFKSPLKMYHTFNDDYLIEGLDTGNYEIYPGNFDGTTYTEGTTLLSQKDYEYYLKVKTTPLDRVVMAFCNRSIGSFYDSNDPDETDISIYKYDAGDFLLYDDFVIEDKIYDVETNLDGIVIYTGFKGVYSAVEGDDYVPETLFSLPPESAGVLGTFDHENIIIAGKYSLPAIMELDGKEQLLLSYSGYTGADFSSIDSNNVDDVAGHHFLTKIKGVPGDDYYFFRPASISQSQENTIIGDMILYPNPAGNVLNLQLDRPYGQYEIHTLAGTRIAHEKVSSGLLTINVSALALGTYFIRLTDDEGHIVTKKFLKK